MSSRTPQECVELAVDTSAEPDDREDAIHELKMANECDELAELVLNGDIEERFRQRALRSLGSSQCDSMLERLVEAGSLDHQFHSDAEELLRQMDDN